MKRILIPIVVIAMIATAAVAAPQRGPGGPPSQNAQGPRPGGQGCSGELPPALLAEFLDLTEAQIAQVQSFRETLRATVEPLQKTQRANQEQIRTAVEAGDAAKAGALLVANHGIAQQIKAAHDAFRTSFESVLTSEQKAKYAVYQELVQLRRDREPRD